MIAGAVWQFLKLQGMAPVYIDGFGDYTASGPAAVSVHAEGDADAAVGPTAPYRARLQIRGKAPNAIAAENVARTAIEHILAANGHEFEWDDPTGQQDRTYRLSAIQIVSRPAWFATPTPGEEVSANLRMMVEEL